MSDPSPDRFQIRLFIAALGIGQICSWGTLFYSFPLIAAAMLPELGWSKPSIFAAATIGLAVSGLATFPVGAMIDRGHGRLIMGLGAVLAGLLLFAWSQVDHLFLFYAIFIGIGLMQACTLYEPSFAVIIRRVGPDRAKRGITAITLWAGFASTVFVPFTQFLLDNMDWREVLLVLGCINIAVSGGLNLLIIRPSRDAVAAPRAASATPPLQGRKAVAWAMRRPVFWLLALAFIAFTATFSAFSYHVYPMLLERGMDTTSVVTVIAVIGPAQVAGRIAIWTLAPNASMRSIGSAVMIAFPLSLAAFALLPTVLALMIVTAVLYGAAVGIITIVRGLAVPEMVSRQAYGAINGAMVAPSLIAMAFAPLGAAALWTIGADYGPVLVALVVGGLLSAAGFWAAAFLSTRPGHGPEAEETAER